MKKGKLIALWVLTVYFATAILAFMPSFSSLFALLVVAIVIPIPKWQNFLSKYLHGKLKVIIAIALVFLTIFTAPISDIDDTTNIVPSVTTDLPSVPSTENTVETTTNVYTEPTTTATTETTIAPTTAPTTAPATEPPHVHNFNAATCTTPKTCSCGVTEGNANGHSWNDATYSAPKTCTACGNTEGDPLDVPGKENYHGHVYTGGSSSTKYHYEEDCAGKYSHEITWEEVDDRNLGPCGTCVLK